MNCLFCSDKCSNKIQGPKGPAGNSHAKYTIGWWLCEKCKVHFYTSSEMDIYTIFIIQFHVHKSHGFYHVQCDIQHNRTRVYYFRYAKEGDQMDVSNSLQPILDFKPVLTNVSPQNIEDKLQTLLVFS